MFCRETLNVWHLSSVQTVICLPLFVSWVPPHTARVAESVCLYVCFLPGRDASHCPGFVLSSLPSSSSHLYCLRRPSLSHLRWTHVALPGSVHVYPGTRLWGRRLQVSGSLWLPKVLCLFVVFLNIGYIHLFLSYKNHSYSFKNNIPSHVDFQ